MRAARWARRGEPRWQPTALISLTLTVVTELMAISYWTLMSEVVWSWYLPNLVLVLWPLPYLCSFSAELTRSRGPELATAST